MFAVFDNADVSHFRTCGILSLINFAVDDNTAADTRSEGYHNRVLHAFCRTGYCFSERRHIGVVAEIYGLVYILLHKFTKRYVRAVFEVVGIDKSAVFRIKISGAAYTYRNDVVFRHSLFRKQIKYALCHISNNFVKRAVSQRFDGLFRKNFSLFV